MCFCTDIYRYVCDIFSVLAIMYVLLVHDGYHKVAVDLHHVQR